MAITLTPNRRLASFLKRQYNLKQQSLGHAVWEEAQIYPLHSWLEQQWRLLVEFAPGLNSGGMSSADAMPKEFQVATRLQTQMCNGTYIQYVSSEPSRQQRSSLQGEGYISFDLSQTRVLTTLEQQLLWEQIIIKSDVGEQLLNSKITATNAIKAWNILLQWNISLAEITPYCQISSEEMANDCAAFLQWASAYQQKCTANAWLDFNSMVNLLIEYIESGVDCVPNLATEYIWYAFQELSPQQERLIAALRKRGAKVKLDVNVNDPVTTAVSADDVEQEYTMAAKWAMQQYNEHNFGQYRANQIMPVGGEQQKNKSFAGNSCLQIGVVIPNLEHCRKDVDRIFAEVFAAAGLQQSYNISAPKSMAKYAMIDTALLMLQLATGEIVDLEMFSRLLRSSFVASGGMLKKIYAKEMCARAEVDVKLRALLEGRFSWKFLDQYLAEYQHTTGNIPCFFQHYTQWREVMDSIWVGNRQTYFWRNKVDELLASLGWPENAENSTIEYHLQSCWDEILAEYAKLDFILPAHDLFTTWQILQNLAVSTPFLPEAKEMPIQVLGVLEAAGMQFDKVWILGMDRETWPPESEPNPFIPITIQRKYNLPRSSPQRELEVAKRLTWTFLTSSRQKVVVSYAKNKSDTHTDISPLFSNIPKVHVEVENAHEFGQIAGRQIFEQIVDNKAPELVAVEKDRAYGSRVLKLQSNCPFWAFAEIRLGAKAIKTRTMGLTAAERGTLLHEVLAELWGKLGSQDRLQQIKRNELTVILDQIIAANLLKLHSKRQQTLTATYMQLENKRLHGILSAWLDLEGTRDPFVVYKIESSAMLQLGNLKFKLRLDRLDKLNTGEIMILDYKTSKPQIASWFGERLQDPQLPMYCLATRLETSEAAFAVIRPELTEIKQYSAINNANKAESWDKQLDKWQQNLELLAAEFSSGNAVVDPLNGKNTCKQCNLQLLCRVE